MCQQCRELAFSSSLLQQWLVFLVALPAVKGILCHGSAQLPEQDEHWYLNI